MAIFQLVKNNNLLLTIPLLGVSEDADREQIKNDLIGDGCEAVELYPAGCRLVDSADSFHLWGVTDKKFRFPLGFGDRLVTDCEREAGTQRKL